jgi:uncharacterized protein YfaS (alpha-2-macroglobulin family)
MQQDGDGRFTRRWDSEVYHFRTAYVARAVTPGQFALPAASAEHMYSPAIRARTATGTLVVRE